MIGNRVQVKAYPFGQPEGNDRLMLAKPLSLNEDSSQELADSLSVPAIDRRKPIST